ncbi:MAG: hypothetical protein WCC59_19165, partial [Terriglobales bacterium]
VEVAMFAAGVYLYAHATRAFYLSGRYLLVAFVGLLLILYGADRFSPPPPSVAAIAWTGIAAAIIFLPWSWWIDRHRTSDW